MKHKCLCIIFLLFISLHAFVASAEELYRQFSLDGGSISSAPADPKAPAPGMVTAKYGFQVAKDFLPYFGTGLAYSYQSDAKTGDVTRFKTGVAAHFGFDYLLGDNLTLKMDYKYLTVTPEQMHGGDPGTPPQSLGIGLDIKF